MDFTAGTIERAPKWVAKSGLEWAWRIKADPALWKRYAKDGIALAGLLARRLPFQLGLGKQSMAGAAVEAESIRTGDGVQVQLSGDLVHSQVASVRKAFRDAAKAGANVRLDLKKAGVLDRSFLGLVLMLEKHVTRNGAVIEILNASPRQLRLFRVNAMDYRIVEDNGQDSGFIGGQNVAMS